MKRIIVAAAAAVALAAVPFSGATAAPERTAKVGPGQTYSWTGAAETNANPYYFAVVGSPAPSSVGPFAAGRCSAAAYEQCDDILIEFSNPLTQAEIDKGVKSKFRSATITLTESPARVADFDFQVFQSDANGTKGGYWTGAESSSQSGNFNIQTSGEELTVEVGTTAAEPSKWMLIRVVRFVSPNATYTASVTF